MNGEMIIQESIRNGPSVRLNCGDADYIDLTESFPMDDLTEALSASFAVSKEHNSTAAPHPRLAQYKCKYSVLEQSERRRRFLDLQKRCEICNIAHSLHLFRVIHLLSILRQLFLLHSKRLNYVNHARRLADGDWTGADSGGEEDMENQEEGKQGQDDRTEEEGMEIERRKLPKHYANQVSSQCISLCVSLFQLIWSLWPLEGAGFQTGIMMTKFYSLSADVVRVAGGHTSRTGH